MDAPTTVQHAPVTSQFATDPNQEIQLMLEEEAQNQFDADLMEKKKPVQLSTTAQLQDAVLHLLEMGAPTSSSGHTEPHSPLSA
jgi:hypothetical protein